MTPPSPKISVVIPTHNRALTLPRALAALARQTCGSDAFEVILVADGCRDQTVATATSLAVPFSLRVLETPGLGAAAARNLGAAAVTTPLILFLDDDMEASPKLIEAHLRVHASQARAVVLGYFTMPDHGFETDLLQVGTRAWWSAMFSNMRQPSHRFSFKDMFAGNVSMPRAVLEAAGGFDTGFKGKAGEDYELAVRLLRTGAHFRFAPDAASVHHDEPTVQRSFQRAAAEGRGHVLMLQRHPELYVHMRLCEVLEGPKRSILWRWIWTRPRLAASLMKIAMLPLTAARLMHMRRTYRGLYGFMHRASYWTGVRQELGSIAQLQRFTQDLPLVPQNVREIELDLALGLTAACDHLDHNDVDAVRLRWGSRPIGRIAPIAGTEPLRGRHLRDIVAARFNSALMLCLDSSASSAETDVSPRRVYPTLLEAS